MMKLVIDIEDNKAAAFMEMLKKRSGVKARRLSAPDAAVLEELKHIRRAFKDVEKIETGKLKTRPLSALLNEL